MLVVVVVVVMMLVDLTLCGSPYADDKRCVKLCMDICLKLEVTGGFDKCFEICKIHCRKIIRLCTNCDNSMLL